MPYRFSTKRYYPDFGLSDFGFRFYSAELGRWINRDPLGIEGGLNLYAFVGNSPVSYIDALGLDPDMNFISEVYEKELHDAFDSNIQHKDGEFSIAIHGNADYQMIVYKPSDNKVEWIWYSPKAFLDEYGDLIPEGVTVRFYSCNMGKSDNLHSERSFAEIFSEQRKAPAAGFDDYIWLTNDGTSALKGAEWQYFGDPIREAEEYLLTQ